jgi:hypothetical protein
MAMTETRKAADLIWDKEIYPRTDISATHVMRLVSALQAGSALPPIVIDRKTRTIVDGVHRWKARQKLGGQDVELEVDCREFQSANEMFLAAIELNSAHGLGFSSYDITRSAVRALERGIELQALAEAVHIPVAGIQRRLQENTAWSRDLGITVPLKGAMKSLAGKDVTEQQMAANRFSGGMRPVYYINQLVALLDAGLYDWGSENERAALKRLQKKLREKLVRKRN